MILKGQKTYNMRKISIQVLIILTSLSLNSCSFKYSQNGLRATNYRDELNLAKKSLRLIDENKPDSLKALFNNKASKNLNQEAMNWIMVNIQNILNNYKYPVDSKITVNETKNKSLTGETIYHQFVFPFEKGESNDSTKYLKITIVNKELYRFSISSGLQFIH